VMTTSGTRAPRRRTVRGSSERLRVRATRIPMSTKEFFFRIERGKREQELSVVATPTRPRACRARLSTGSARAQRAPRVRAASARRGGFSEAASSPPSSGRRGSLCGCRDTPRRRRRVGTLGPRPPLGGTRGSPSCPRRTGMIGDARRATRHSFEATRARAVVVERIETWRWPGTERRRDRDNPSARNENEFSRAIKGRCGDAPAHCATVTGQATRDGPRPPRGPRRGL